MPLTRVTATLPPDLVKSADRLARQRTMSRSAVLAEALDAYLAGRRDRPPVGRRVAEPTVGESPGAPSPVLPHVSDEALLAELRRRLGLQAAGVPVRAALPRDRPKVAFDREKLAELCRRHCIRNLSLFGSVLRDDFGPTSDVDVLVEFEPGHTPGLAITDIEDELSALFGGHRVDLVTEKSLHRLVRDRVLSSAVLQYAA